MKVESFVKVMYTSLFLLLPMKHWRGLTASLIVLICFGLCCISAINHAIYLSILEIEHAASTNTAEVRIKVFTDDMQDALRNFNATFVPTNEDEFCQTSPLILSDYFDQHLNIRINNIPGELRFIDCQQANDVYWLNFQINCPTTWEQLIIKADFLMELFPSQSNIIHLTNEEKKHFFRLTSKESMMEQMF